MLIIYSICSSYRTAIRLPNGEAPQQPRAQTLANTRLPGRCKGSPCPSNPGTG